MKATRSDAGGIGLVDGPRHPFASAPAAAVSSRASARAATRSLLDVFAETLAHFGGHTAIDAPDAVLTYADLWEVVQELAGRLRGLGVGPGDRVGVYVPSGSAQLYAAILGVLAAGAAYVPVDADDPPARARAIWEESGACAVIDDGLRLTALGDARGAGREVSVEDDAWVIFTSGSTGQPKGVAVSHRSAAAFVDAYGQLFGVRPDDRVLGGLSVAFDASCEEIWLAWRHGAALVPAPRALVRAGWELGPWLAERAVSVISTVPTLAAMWDERDIAGVRVLILGGEACPESLAWRLASGREAWNTYGPTEAAVASTASRLRAGVPVTIGWPLRGWELAIVDERGDPVALGEPGELVIGGVGLGRYLDPVLDRERFAELRSLGWKRAYRTGDLVRETLGGLRFIGRRDDQVKLGGHRLELGEIDAALSAVPGVRAGAAALQTTAAGDPLLVGYVVGEVDPAQVRAALAERLPRAIIPHVVRIDALPTSASGKVDRKALPWPAPARGVEIERRNGVQSEIKIRGYHVELAEIESVLRSVPGVSGALVDTYQPEPDVRELVAYYSLRPDTDGVDSTRIHGALSERLPAYMVPAYLEQIEEIPLTRSGQADRDRLPAPGGPPRRLAADDGYVAPASDTEFVLADQLASILGVKRVSVDSHFFDDLGANSLLMARFNGALRKGAGGLPAISMKEIYSHPTVRRLAAAVCGRQASEPSGADFAEREMPAASGTPRYLLCGALQPLALLGYLLVASVGLAVGASWLAAAHGGLEIYARALVFGAGILLATGGVPILAKWALIGRFKPQRIRVWSMAYLRFWIVKTLLVFNPVLRLCAGTPLYPLYLRALGAKIGRGAVILTTHVPVCTDLVSVGARSVIRKEAYLNGYRARAGAIEIGPVAVGEGVFVSERTVLDIYTTMEDGSQLGHTSALRAGQVVPAGQCWHGSPAEPAGEDCEYQTLPAGPPDRKRAVAYGASRAFSLLAIAGPLEAVLATLLLTHHGPLAQLNAPDALTLSAAVLFGLLLAALLVAITVPRLLTHALTPGRVYPLYGVHYALLRIISRTSNVQPLKKLFGDCWAIVHYLRWIGWRVGVIVQTGSNFGTITRYAVPALSEVGTGTMVACGLSMMNAEYSSSSFRVMPVVIGGENYLGNHIAYPPGGRTGENCLLGTKVMVPIRGPLRSNVGLLGSPCFEIPRSVKRDQEFEHLLREPEFARRLAAKRRHNLVTIGLHLLVSWLLIAGFVLLASSPLGGSGWRGVAGTLATAVAALVFTVVLFVAVERVLTACLPVRPRFCSIYELDYWRHERYWKVPATAYIQMFNGTPIKPFIWRLLGVKIGHRVFDDGCQITERPLVAIGSESTLNVGCTLQSHTLEEGRFKSEHITIGRGCSVGISAIVNYGVLMEDESQLDADSFLMKGSYVSPGARWGGNPATEVAIKRTERAEWTGVSLNGAASRAALVPLGSRPADSSAASS